MTDFDYKQWADEYFLDAEKIELTLKQNLNEINSLPKSSDQRKKLQKKRIYYLKIRRELFNVATILSQRL